MGINSILNFFKLDEDEENELGYSDGYEETYEEPKEKPVKRSTATRTDYEEEPKQRSFLSSKPKVVPMNNRSMMEVINIIKPKSFEDSQNICNVLLSNHPVVVNLEGFDPDDAQRIMDFVSGCIYSINGKYHQISKYIFIFSPENVDISGDALSFAGDTATMPTIQREF